MALKSSQEQYLNFAISLLNSVHSLEVVKLRKSDRFLKKAPKLTLQSTVPFHYSPSYQKSLKELFVAKQENCLNKIHHRFQSGV